MARTRKIAAILVADVVGYSRLAGADEDRTLARLRALRSDLIDPAIDAHRGRIVKRTGDGSLIEFRSVVDAVRCAIEVQNGLIERNAGVPPERRIEFRVGIHLGDVVEESDGDLMGDGVNIAARLEGIAEPGGDLPLRGTPTSRCATGSKRSSSISARRSSRTSRGRCGSMRSRWLATRRVRAERCSAATPRSPPRLSIVVLPFANIGGDPEQDYFVDGVTESLTTDLSRISGSFVIGRNTAFTYKGKAIDVKQIGRELNVRYVLEGSIQRGGNRMRVNVQLIDAETGSHLWAERFDKPVADLFDMQDEIVSRLANRLGHELARAEARRAERSATRIRWITISSGLRYSTKAEPPSSSRRRVSHFDRALELDPDNVDALVGRAWVDLALVSQLVVRRPARAAALRRGRRGQGAQTEAGQRKRPRALGRANLEQPRRPGHRRMRARAGDRPKFSRRPRMDRLGEVSYRPLRGNRGPFLEALRISPRDTYAGVWMLFAANAKLGLGRDEEAVAWLNRAVELNPMSPIPHSSRGRARASRPNRGRGRGRARRPRAQPEFHHLAVPILAPQRQSGLPRVPRAHV